MGGGIREGEKLDGRAAERRWVLEDADYPLLLDLAELELPGDPKEAWPYLLGSLVRSDELYRYDRDHAPSLSWIKGFIEGAKEAWAEVKDKI
jgi:hypothetical protein